MHAAIEAPAVDAVPLNRPTAVLTDRGHAARTVYRLAHQLRGLDAADRAAILELLKLELVELPVTA